MTQSHIMLSASDAGLAAYGSYRVDGIGVYGTVLAAQMTMAGTVALIDSIGAVMHGGRR